jgi:hypothetical protein
MADGMYTDPTPIRNKGKILRVDRAAKFQVEYGQF